MFFLPFARRINDRIPWVIFGLVAVNVAVTVHTFFGFDQRRIQEIFGAYGAIATDLRPHAWFSHMFLHAGPAHLVGNVAFLVLFGMNVERRLGAARTLLLYLLSGFAALALFIVFNRSFSAPLVGASGAVSGVIGAYLVLFRRRTVEVLWFAFVVGGIVQLPSTVVASLWIGLEFLQAILLNDRVMVAHWAHVGGFIGGALLTLPLLKLFPGHPEVYPAHGEAPKAPDLFDEKGYVPEAPGAPRPDSFRLVAAQWRPVTSVVRRIVDGVSPGSGAFATAARLAGGLAPPQAADLRSRLERAGYPASVLEQKGEIPAAPVVFLASLAVGPDGLDVVDQRGARRMIAPGSIVRIQEGSTRGGIPILDIVTRDPWMRYRLSGATAAVSLPETAARLREAHAGRMEPDGASFESLADLDDYFRWRLQRSA